MGKFVENNLLKDEEIVKKANLSKLSLILSWVFGVLFCWLFLVPTIKAIWNTLRYVNTYVVITNKRVVAKSGFGDSASLDLPLNKVQSVSVQQGVFQRLFKYGSLRISTASGEMKYDSIQNPEQVRSVLMAQMDQYEEDRIKQQAAEMANAMASVVKPQ